MRPWSSRNEAAAAAILRQFDNPYSEASLADPTKAIYDAGPLDIAYPRSGIVPPDVLDEATEQFRQHARLILGDERLAASHTARTCNTTPVSRGFAQIVDKLHIDGRVDDLPQISTIRVVGIYHNHLPTLTMLDPVRPSDFSDGRYLESVDGVPLGVSRPALHALPLGRISIFGANIPHTGQRAARRTRRVFLRWQMFVPFEV